MHDICNCYRWLKLALYGFNMIVCFHLSRNACFSFVAIDNFSSNVILTVNMQVYVDLFSIAILLLGGALACYGEHLLFYVVFFPAFSNCASHVMHLFSM